MERRRLFAVGGVLSVTAFATTVGLGATFGLFGLTQPDSPVGRLGGPTPAAAQVDPRHGGGATTTGTNGTTGITGAPGAPAPTATAGTTGRPATAGTTPTRADDGADD